MQIITLEERIVFENRYLKMYDDAVLFPSGVHGSYVKLRWRDQGSVAVVPVTPEGKVLLVRQFCYAAQRVVLQIPKGFWSAYEVAEEAAKRELREELGAEAEAIYELIRMHVDPGIICNWMHVFIATGTRIVCPVEHETTEAFGQSEQICLRNLENELDCHQISDPVTVSALFLARRKIGAQPLDAAASG